MTWQQALVVAWIQFALAAALMLWSSLVALRWLRQPAERARIVPLALAAALAVPLLTLLAPWPTWNLGWIAPASVPVGSQPAAAPTGTASGEREGLFTYSPGPAPIDPAGSNSSVSTHRAAPVPATSRNWNWDWSIWSIAAAAIIAAHLVAAGYLALRWAIGRRQLARLGTHAEAAPDSVLAQWEELTGQAGRRVRLLVAGAIDAPLVFGWRRPTVVIPLRVAAGRTLDLHYCLAHEWSHIERGDLTAWHWIQACQYVFWYQPAYWSLAKELRLCQELLADDRTARTPEDRLDYCELLLGLAMHRQATPVSGALNMFDEPSQLGRRVRLLVEGTGLATRCRRRVAWTALAVALTMTSALSMIRLEAARAEADAKTETKADDAKRNVHPSIAEYKAEQARDSAPGALPAALNYSGRVIDKTNKSPIAGAKVVVRRSDLSEMGNEILEESQHTTDASGTFSFVIPPEQVAHKRLYIELDVEHPDYAAKKGHGYALSMIRKNEMLGAPPFFAETELYPGEPVTGRVVSPEGTPLAGIKVQGFSSAKVDDFNAYSFVDTVTGADGTFRLPLVKDGPAVMWVIPQDYAIAQRYLNRTRGDQGEFKLEPGIRVSGQVLDAAGKPVANVPVNIDRDRSKESDAFNELRVSTSVRRGLISDAEGRFAFGPLPPGDYQLAVNDYNQDPLVRDRKQHTLPGVWTMQKLTLSADVSPEPVRMQAVPHVVVEAQFYNSKGEPTNGHGPRIFGRISTGYWHTSAHAIDGHVVALVPHGLREAKLQLSTNEHSSLRYRLKKGDPLKSERFDISLGTLDDDLEGIEIIRYSAPIVLVGAVDETGQPIKSFKVSAAYPWGKQRYILDGETRSDLTFETQPDGRRRSEQMLPDEEVTLTVKADGYEDQAQKISLPEGEFKELTLTLKRKPTAEAKTSTAASSAPTKE